jgi:hypothetical protein
MTALKARASQRQKQVPKDTFPPLRGLFPMIQCKQAKVEKSRLDALRLRSGQAGATKINGLMTRTSPALGRVVPLSHPKRGPYKLLPRKITEHPLSIYAFPGMAPVRC